MMTGTKHLSKGDEEFIGTMMPILDHRARKVFIASFSRLKGHGSARELSDLTGMSEHTISVAKKELCDMPSDPSYHTLLFGKRQRAEGAGRRRTEVEAPEIIGAIDGLIEGKGSDDCTMLRWTTKSVRSIRNELELQGYSISHDTVARILTDMGFTIQLHRKYSQSDCTDDLRTNQFRRIAFETNEFQKSRLPVVWVGVKRIDSPDISGQVYHASDESKAIEAHFHHLGEETTFHGIIEIDDRGSLRIGMDERTAEMSSDSIRNWWYMMGRYCFPDSKDLMVVADCGKTDDDGFMSWVSEMQSFSNDSGMDIHVRHMPPGTFRWSRIEQTLFTYNHVRDENGPGGGFLTTVCLLESPHLTNVTGRMCVIREWRGRRRHRTSTGCPEVNITRDGWHGEWNYTISPSEPRSTSSSRSGRTTACTDVPASRNIGRTHR